MKRLLLLFLLPASLALAEDATLSINTVMRTDKSLVILKAGTVVQVLQHNEKTASIKVGGKTGLIPLTALDILVDEGDMMDATPVHPRSPPRAPAPARAKAAAPIAAAATPPPPPAPAPPRKAQTMYGKAVEKAKDAAASHEKAMVNPADEIVDGK